MEAKKWILFAFISVMVISLTLHGVNNKYVPIDTNKIKIDSLELILSKLDAQNSYASKKIDSLSSRLNSRESVITELQDSIYEFRNRKPDTITKYEKIYEKVFERPTTPVVTPHPNHLVNSGAYHYRGRNQYEGVHPYGKGLGRIVLYKTCDCYNLRVWVNGEEIGYIISPSNYPPNSEGRNTVGKSVPVGNCHVLAVDQYNHRWDLNVWITEDRALFQGLRL